MYLPYQCCSKSIEDYYVHQAGSGLPFYQGSSLQQGHGLGGFFRALIRGAIPLFKRGAKVIGKQALRSGVDFASDVMQGQDPKMAASKRAKEAGNLLTDKASAKIKAMIGQGHKRKRKTVKRIIRSKARKLRARDIFDH